MNKLLKLTIITCIAATSGIAYDVLESTSSIEILRANERAKLGERLLFAVQDKDPLGAIILLSNGANPNAQYENDKTALQYAEELIKDPYLSPEIKGQFTSVVEIMNARLALETALFDAIRAGSSWGVRYLLKDHMVNPNARDKDGKSALDIAIENENEEITNIIRYAITQASVASSGYTAEAKPIVDQQETNKAELDFDDTLGNWYTFGIEYDTNFDEVMKSICNGEKSVNDTEKIKVNSVKKDTGYTVLMAASKRGCISEVKKLLALNADVNAVDRITKMTALMIAVKNDRVDVVDTLLAVNGINVNIKDNYGNTALIYSVVNGHAGITKSLLGAGADVNVTVGRDNKTALIQAAILGRADIVNVLLGDHNIDATITDSNGNTALMAASQWGQETVVNILIANSMIDVNARENTKRTALIYAVANGHIEITKALLKAGADVNAAGGRDNKTALIRAVEHGYIDIVNVLLTVQNIDVNIKDDYGDSALMTAISSAIRPASFEKLDVDIVKMLLKAPNIDVNATNKYGTTALMLAEYRTKNPILGDEQKQKAVEIVQSLNARIVADAEQSVSPSYVAVDVYQR